MTPFLIDCQMSGIVFDVSRPRTTPPGVEGVDWFWDVKTCTPRVKRACTECGRVTFVRQTQPCCSVACGAVLAKRSRRVYSGENNPKWRGGDVKYLARHVRVRTARGSASEYACDNCESPAKEWAHIHDTDPFDVANYTPLCVRCHRNYDLPMALRGEQHPRSKLTADIVREIRAQYAVGAKTQCQLATDFGVIQATISKIVARKIWKEVMP
jgi:hypothetical protein